MLVEDYEFFQQLPPKDQTELIKLLFADFRLNFRHFFDPCEQGFVNEAIIWMFTRRYRAGTTNQMICQNGIKMTELYFICEGTFGLFTSKYKEETKRLPPFMVLPKYRIYGDYQILHDLFPNFDFATYMYDQRDNEVNERIAREDINVETYVVMCLDAEKLEDLCELYPMTAKSLKIRALDRREFFLKEMQKQERELEAIARLLGSKVGMVVDNGDTNASSIRTIDLEIRNYDEVEFG